MNLYRVTRPHCAPSTMLVVAPTKADAIALANKTFGAVAQTRAVRLLMDRARILVAGVDPQQALLAPQVPTGRVM